MGAGSLTYVALVKEDTAGTTPTNPTLQKIRNTGGAGITNDRSSITSSEMRSDRQIVSSRLGGNKPGCTIPFELSFHSQDELISASLGSDWIGNYQLTVDVDFGDGDGTITTDDGTDWEDLGVAVGDYITIANAATAGNDGVYYVSDVTADEMTVTEIDGTTAVAFTISDADEISLIGGWYGFRIDASGNSLTVASADNSLTATTADTFDTTYIKKGDKLYFEGFTETANNGWHKVSTVSGTVLTFDDTETFTDETISVGDVDYVTQTAIVTCGVDMNTYTIEEGYTDIAEYHNISGSKGDSFSLSIQPDAIVSGECALKGTAYSGMLTSPISGATYVDENSLETMDTYTGDLFIDSSVDDCVITGFDVSISNNLSERNAIMKQDLCSLGEGRINVTGTISLYFVDGTYARKYYNEDSIDLLARTLDPDGNAYGIGMPIVKFTSESRDKQENDVTESIGFQALGGDEVLTTFYVIKQYA